jgi:hypothetical protein
MAPPARIPAAALIDGMRAGKYPFWYPEGAIRNKLDYDFFAYGVSFTGTNVLTASQTITLPININSDSAFLILSAAMVETATDNTTFLTQFPILVQLNEGGGARNLFNAPQHANNVFGTGEQPKYWDVPKLLLPNSTFNVQLQNLEAVNRNVHVTFSGFKIFGWQK